MLFRWPPMLSSGVYHTKAEYLKREAFFIFVSLFIYKIQKNMKTKNIDITHKRKPRVIVLVGTGASCNQIQYSSFTSY